MPRPNSVIFHQPGVFEAPSIVAGLPNHAFEHLPGEFDQWSPGTVLGTERGLLTTEPGTGPTNVKLSPAQQVINIISALLADESDFMTSHLVWANTLPEGYEINHPYQTAALVCIAGTGIHTVEAPGLNQSARGKRPEDLQYEFKPGDIFLALNVKSFRSTTTSSGLHVMTAFYPRQKDLF